MHRQRAKALGARPALMPVSHRTPPRAIDKVRIPSESKNKYKAKWH
jgi:hypothetical protein